MNTQDKDIVANTQGAGNFSQFYNALMAADLVATYKGPGPFTFFAPTDEAFKKLPDGTLQALLKDKAKIASFVNNHVIKGSLLAKNIKARDSKSVQGETLTFVASGTGFTVNGAKGTNRDIESSNGVVHAIDTVMLVKA